MNRLKELRTEKRLTIRELGELTNISFPSISYMENETRPFTQANLEILCNFFNVSADYMLGKSAERYVAKANTPKFAMYGLENDLTDEEKKVLLDMAKIMVNNKKNK